MLKGNHDLQISHLDSVLQLSRMKSSNLQLQLAEKTGENNALVAMQDKWQDKIDGLEKQVENNQSQAASSQQKLDSELAQTKRNLAVEKAKVERIIKTIDNRSLPLLSLSLVIADSLQKVDSLFKFHLIEIIDGNIEISITQALLFRKGSTRVRTGGLVFLEKLSEVLINQPQIDIEVEGHTDNKLVREYKSNWDFSALRAAAVVRVLTKDFELNPSQITLSAKGEFAPRASNETSEGRGLNRRIDIVISQRVEKILKEIKKVAEE